jgi:hypothetical protein
MPIYEVPVIRTVESEETATLVVRAKSPAAAAKKALRIVKANPDQWFGPISVDTFIRAVAAERLDFQPDCEVL